MYTLMHYASHAKTIPHYFKKLTSLVAETLYDYYVVPVEPGHSDKAVAILWIHSKYASIEKGWAVMGRHCYLDSSGHRIVAPYTPVEFSQRVDDWLEALRRDTFTMSIPEVEYLSERIDLRGSLQMARPQ